MHTSAIKILLPSSKLSIALAPLTNSFKSSFCMANKIENDVSKISCGVSLETCRKT